MSDQINTPSGRNKRPRRIAAILVALLAVAALAYVGNWFATAWWLETRIAAWEEAERAKGNDIAHGALRIEGFPFRMSVLTDGFLYRRHRGPVTELVRAEALRVSARPWAPLDLTMIADAGLTAAQTQTASGKTVTLTAGPGTRLQASFYGSGMIEHARLTTFDGVLSADEGEGGAGPREAARFAAATATLDQAERIDDYDDAAAVVTLTAAKVESPALAALGTGKNEVALTLEATLRGLLDGSAPADLALWRDNGGTLDIDRFTIAMDPVGLKLNATLALDGLLRPEGAGTLEIKGFDEALGDLVSAGHIKRDAAEIAKLVLGAFSRTSAVDGTRIVSLPIAAQDGRVSAGPFTLFRFPAAF